MTLAQVLKTFRINGTKLYVEFMGGIISNAAALGVPVTLTYVSGAAIAIDASLGNAFVVSITNNVNFSFAAPTIPPPTGFTQDLTITIRNTSGGAHGTGTWDAAFKTTGNVPAIATAHSRTFGFAWNGTNWVQTFATAADVAN